MEYKLSEIQTADKLMASVITSFPAIVGPKPSVLILGSMPGTLSLAQNQYYAHPRNRFWPVIQELLHLEPDLSYEERIAAIRVAGVALWDVLKQCERDGSLDVSINATSEVPNDFNEFFGSHPSIRAVFFNGKKAAATFRRKVMPLLDSKILTRMRLAELPSTSPANAGVQYPALLESWRVIRQ